MPSLETPLRKRALLLLLAGLAGLYAARLGRPFDGHMEACLAQYASFGRNYERFGYLASGGAPIDAAGPSLEPYGGAGRQIYSHRPPLVSLIVSVPLRIFGQREGVLRATLIAAALGAVLLFSRLARRVLGAPWDLVATACFGAAPIFAYYAVTTVHQVFALLGILLIYLAYLRWREQPTRGRLAALLAVETACTWLDWPVYFAIGAVSLLQALHGAPRRRHAILLFGLPVAAGIGSFLLYLFLLDPAGREPLRGFWASGTGHRGAATAGLGAYLADEARELALHFTLPLLALALGGLLRMRPLRRFEDALVASTLLLGSDEVLFPSMCRWHDYLTLPLIVFAALAAAVAVRDLAARPWGRALAAAALAVAALQAGAVLWKRWTFTGYHFVEVEIARSIARHTRPEDRVLLRLNLDPYLAAYYADRYFGLYSEPRRQLDRCYVDPPETGLDADALLARLSAPGSGFTVLATMDAERASDRFAWIRGLDPAGREDFVARWYGWEIPSRPSRLVEGLKARFPWEEAEGLFLARLPR